MKRLSFALFGAMLAAAAGLCAMQAPFAHADKIWVNDGYQTIYGHAQFVREPGKKFLEIVELGTERVIPFGETSELPMQVRRCTHEFLNMPHPIVDEPYPIVEMMLKYVNKDGENVIDVDSLQCRRRMKSVYTQSDY